MRYFLIFSIIFSIGSLIENVVCISEDDEELIEKINNESEKILNKMQVQEEEFLESIPNESEKKKKQQQFSKKMQKFKKNLTIIQNEINNSSNNNID